MGDWIDFGESLEALGNCTGGILPLSPPLRPPTRTGADLEMGEGDDQGEAQGEGEEAEARFRQPSARPLASTDGGRMSNASRKLGGLWFPHYCHPRPSSGHLSSAALALPPSPQTQRPEELHQR